MKITVIWGTGKYTEMFLLAHKEEEYGFFIDNNRAKDGLLFHGKKVYHPDSIEVWKNLFIILPYYEYSDIKKQVEGYGLKEGTDFVRMSRIQFADRTIFDNDYLICKIHMEKIISNMSTSCKKMVFWCCPDFFDRIYDCRYVTEVAQKDYEVVMVSEKISDRYKSYYTDINEITAPLVFDQSFCMRIENEHMQEKQQIDDVYKVYIKHFIDHYEGITEDAAIVTIKMIISFLDTLISEINPELIICTASVSPPHRLIKEYSNKNGIKTVFLHQGVIAGTIAFDIGGEMGESLPAKRSDEFCALNVDKEDLKKAEEVIDYIRTSKENRKKQPNKTGIEIIKKKIKENRPILLFAAQCDAASGLECDDYTRKKYHSPMFESSFEAGIFLARLAKKNDWNLIYKPHPMYTKDDFERRLPGNVIYIEEGNLHDIIDMSDVVITILSQTAYEALIRNKPVVMLGMMQINKKGCAYEAYNAEDIEGTIKEALDKGYTQNQKRAFVRHVAQLLKYYLFSDLKERKISYGKGKIESLDEIYGF